MGARQPVLAGLTVFAVVVVAVVGSLALLGRQPPNDADGTASAPPTSVAGTPGPSAGPTEPSAGPTEPSTGPTEPSTAPTPRSPLGVHEEAFVDAYRNLAETHDREVAELLISNPLAEYDLVGTRLTELIDRTSQQLTGLPPLAATDDRSEELEREVDATLGLLRAIDPHGPKTDQATAYQQALDYWVEHVQPVSNAIRATLGLPAAPTGDLRL